MKSIKEQIMAHVFITYLKLLKRTVHIQWDENVFGEGGKIFGFWHEDSLLMNLVLEKLSARTCPVDVIVTADKRGDYIEAMLRRCGGNALRVPVGYASFGALKKIMQHVYETTRSVAVALDGPLGPRHEPKKLAFYMAEQAKEDFVGISAAYSSCIRLNWRWDKYALPLPFSTVTVAMHNYGEVNKTKIPELPTIATKAEYGILCTAAEPLYARRA